MGQPFVNATQTSSGWTGTQWMRASHLGYLRCNDVTCHWLSRVCCTISDGLRVNCLHIPPTSVESFVPTEHAHYDTPPNLQVHNVQIYSVNSCFQISPAVLRRSCFWLQSVSRISDAQLKGRCDLKPNEVNNFTARVSAESHQQTPCACPFSAILYPTCSHHRQAGWTLLFVVYSSTAQNYNDTFEIQWRWFELSSQFVCSASALRSAASS